MQASGALEAQISTVLRHGPGHHLGSNGVDAGARALLAPLADLIDTQPTVERYLAVLHILKRAGLHRGDHVFDEAKLVAQIRNELTHHKPHWNSELEKEKLFQRREKKALIAPPLTPHASAFFPDKCLSAELGVWAVSSVVLFFEGFYKALGCTNPFDTMRARIVALTGAVDLSSTQGA